MTPSRRPWRWTAAGLFAAALAVLSAGATPGGQSPPSTSTPAPDRTANDTPRAKPVAKGAAAEPARPPRREASPAVVSKAKEKEQGRGSDFLRPPGSSRYDPDAVDWREVPPWRQASYFGIRAQGQFFVYVVDCSGSMVDEDRLARAKEELRRSVAALQPPQRFLVIFYNDEPIPMPGGLPRSAGLSAREQFLAWLRLIEPDGGTDPMGAIGNALSLRPDAVFLLSDGEFPEGTVEAIARKNPRKTPIHCIDLSGGAAGDQLQRIARDSGGRYAPRPWAGP
jgi:hypothetical protein